MYDTQMKEEKRTQLNKHLSCSIYIPRNGVYFNNNSNNNNNNNNNKDNNNYNIIRLKYSNSHKAMAFTIKMTNQSLDSVRYY